MNDFLVGMTLGVQFCVQFHAVSVQHADVQGPKVVVEVLVDELLIHAKVMGVCRVLWLDILLKGHKVQAI